MKTETKHTEGPWRTGDLWNTVFGPPNGQPCPEIIATVHKGKKANARLIAAAPDMLEALELAIPWLAKHIADDQHLRSVMPQAAVIAYKKAEAAIAKARGET